MATYRTGEAYWINDCPPLDGFETKRRPAVFLDLGEIVPDPTALLVFVCATTDDEIDQDVDEDAIWVAHGLPRPCWVMPRWVVEVRPDMVGEHAGRLCEPQLTQLLEAVVDRFFDYGEGLN